MVDNESEIDDPNFFFAKDGKYNAEAELNATLDAFYNETTFTDDAAGCRFPARKAWLSQKLHLKNLPQLECKEYNKILKELSATSATLVFPAAHINSPASMFGHTFLRINSKYHSRLLSYAINYAADADPKKENGITFAIKGLFGGYFGKYSLLPYYEKLKEYRDTEKRDIWEYDLNLSQEEVAKMVRHIWELNGTHSYYYFFTENCSYNMLWLMEIARPSVHLREHFTYEVIPLESVFAVEQEGLITHHHYRASKRTKLLMYEDALNPKYIPLIKTLQKSDNARIEILQDNTIPLQQKQFIFEAAIEYLQYSYAKNSMDKQTYTQRFYQLSQARAQLKRGKILHKQDPQDPLLGHRAIKLSFGVEKTKGEKTNLIVGFRPAYHTLQDPQYGFLRGTQIEFLNTQIAINEDEIQLKELTILSIASIAQRDTLFNPFSWRTHFGFDEDSLDDDANFIATLGAGLSWGNKHGYIYVMADPFYYINTNDGGIGASVGFVIDHYRSLIVTAQATQRLYIDGTDQTLIQTNLGVNMTQNLQLKLQYHFRQKQLHTRYNQEQGMLLLDYFF